MNISIHPKLTIQLMLSRRSRKEIVGNWRETATRRIWIVQPFTLKLERCLRSVSLNRIVLGHEVINNWVWRSSFKLSSCECVQDMIHKIQISMTFNTKKSFRNTLWFCWYFLKIETAFLISSERFSEVACHKHFLFCVALDVMTELFVVFA